LGVGLLELSLAPGLGGYRGLNADDTNLLRGDQVSRTLLDAVGGLNRPTETANELLLHADTGNQGQVEVVLRANEQGGEDVAQVLLLSLKTELQEVRLDGVSSDLIGSLDLSLRGPAGGLEPQGVVANGFHSLIEGRHGVGLKVQLHAVRQAHKLLVQVT